MDKGNAHMSEPADLGLATLANAILALPRGAKRLIMAGADALMLPLALWAALGARPPRLGVIQLAVGAAQQASDIVASFELNQAH